MENNSNKTISDCMKCPFRYFEHQEGYLCSKYEAEPCRYVVGKCKVEPTA